MKKLLIILGSILLFFVLLAVLGLLFFANFKTSWTGGAQSEQFFCATDVKQCPDGSFVGRVAPACEFASCPVESAQNWEAIKTAINNCQVESVFQAHSLAVSVKLKNGQSIRATEPAIDDIIHLASSATSKCGQIRMATE